MGPLSLKTIHRGSPTPHIQLCSRFVKFRPAWLMRPHCGLTSIRCHFEWRRPPPLFLFTNTHTFFPPPPSDDLLLWHCAADVLALARPFSSGWKRHGGGVTGLRMGGVKGEGWHIPQPDHVTTSARGKMAMQPCSAYSEWVHFLSFWGGWGEEKRKGASFKCKCNKQHYCELYPEERWYLIVCRFR